MPQQPAPVTPPAPRPTASDRPAPDRPTSDPAVSERADSSAAAVVDVDPTRRGVTPGAVGLTRDDVRSAIVDAAARLLHEQGARALTTRAVAQAAGVQAPTIYRLFGDKEGLIDAVAEQVMATYVAAKTTSAAGTGDDPVAELRAGWRAHLDFGLANPGLFTLLNNPERAAHSPATAAGIEVLRSRVRRVAAAGLLRVDEDRAVAMIHAAGSGTVLALLGMPADARDPGLSDAMFDTVAARILATAPATPGTDVSTVAVTFRAALPALPALTDAERTLMAEWLSRSLSRLRDE